MVLKVVHRAYFSCGRFAHLPSLRVAGAGATHQRSPACAYLLEDTIYLGARPRCMNPQIEIDYQMLRLEPGDVFVLATDGVYEHLSARDIAKAVNEGSADLDQVAKAIVGQAFEAGSEDNLTVQIVRVDELSDGIASEVFTQPHELPLPPLLEARAVFDGYRIVRELHGSSRSHIYLAVDIETDAVVTIKIPSIDLRDDPDYLKRFMMEEWVARRIDSRMC